MSGRNPKICPDPFLSHCMDRTLIVLNLFRGQEDRDRFRTISVPACGAAQLAREEARHFRVATPRSLAKVS